MKTNISSLTKISIAAILAMQSIGANAEVNFVPSDLEKYTSTKECKNCDISKANLNYYEKAGMQNSLVSGTIFTESTLSGNFDDSDFSNAILARAHCHSSYYSDVCDGTSFRSTNFQNANFLLARFYHTDFSGSNFRGASLVNADFRKANLTSIDFTDAKLDGVDLSDASLSGSIISDQQLLSAKSLCNAILPNGTLGTCK